MSNNEWDFGFTTGEEIAAPQSAAAAAAVKQQVVSANDSLMTMRKMIEPLLNNLVGDENKDYIHWPWNKRQEQIVAFKEKLNAICPLPFSATV